MNIIKNILIVILTIAVFLFWVSADEDIDSSDSVTIEYQCGELPNYENIPPEVVDECRSKKDNKNSDEVLTPHTKI